MRASSRVLVLVGVLLVLGSSVPLAAMLGLMALGAPATPASNEAPVADPNAIPLTLNTVGYAASHGMALSVPTGSEVASSLGASYGVQDVFIESTPHVEAYTASDGSNQTRTTWETSLIVWNQKALNDTTTNVDILNNGGIMLTESPVEAGSNSTAAALAILAPPVVCQTVTTTGQVNCRTASQGSNGAYIVKVNDISIVIAPSTGNVVWLDDRNLHVYTMTSRSVSTTQMLKLAEAMIGG